MDRYKMLAFVFGGFTAGVLYSTACNRGQGGLGSAFAAGSSSCENWNYYLSVEYDNDGCNDKEFPCTAPSGWEPVAVYRGIKGSGDAGDLILMRQCVD